MATIITMPAVVADATEAALQDWLVSVGDTIDVGQPIAEIETEKATVELEAETPGTVGRLLVDPGTSVEVGVPIAVLVQAGEDDAAIDKEIAAAGHAVVSAADQPVPHDTEAPATGQLPEEGAAVFRAPQSPGRIFSSPLARKMAKDLRIDIAHVDGSGPHGRIVRRDIETAVQRLAARAEATSSVPAPPAPSKPKTPREPRPEDSQDVPVSGMRRAIARRLTESKTTVPHFYASVDVVMDPLLNLRTQINEALSGGGQKATVNDLILKALAGALADVPAANVSWQGDSIRRYASVDISVAIATEDGLLTPVVRNLENMPIGALCRATADFKERAASGRIRQQELEGGSFSLTNLGMYGTREFSAILNPPQAGILAVGTAEPRPVVRDGELTIATIMSCTLSADHRAIDGAVAALLLAAFKRRVENPLGILV